MAPSIANTKNNGAILKMNPNTYCRLHNRLRNTFFELFTAHSPYYDTHLLNLREKLLFAIPLKNNTCIFYSISI